MAIILGTNGNSILNGTAADNVIVGLLGNDVITDPGGFNRIDGQDRNDAEQHFSDYGWREGRIPNA